MSTPRPSPFVFVGNHRALDFVNTEVAAEGVPRDLLGGLAGPGGLAGAGRARSTAPRRGRRWRRWGGRRGGDVALADGAGAPRRALRRLADAAAAGQAGAAGDAGDG